MAIVRSEFALALNQVASERGIDPKVVLESIEQAILAAYHKDYGTDEPDLKDDENAENSEEFEETIKIKLDPVTGGAKLVQDGKDITPAGFGRIAAQTAKQVILQRVREAEKSSIMTDYQDKVGTVINGMVLRIDGPNVLIDIGRAQGIMPPREQIPSEDYSKNKRIAVYVKEIREGRRGNEIIVSRGDKSLVEGLFRNEVPEVAQGAVQIKATAREAGSRTKIAVFSDQQGVDPVGSCVGQKGVRVQAVINELGGEEKIDVIAWSDNIEQFIRQSLAPADELTVKINEEEKHALVLAPEDQLSLAIGRNGQNVRLAAQLVGYKIDIRDASGGDEKEKKQLKNDEVSEEK
ncbi:transcription termination/antitermination protein NusA [Candidatus Roizmanbacteria bacterium CG22_combo_CG10-13_8_21_14_all_38_20]|uniref:Transcription termination/antitermination protein NusA n=1 Tax=Candidatus Roizmanbacteria bacterium CG22_combo_CG10-13_8_21_14_all_38_20 TaxID=1974862 RepID=A0A2H0BWF6_9BACT|nr:transcription termination/antitermination protein NusA [Candidatus Microgenomates bacterium]PIP61971.1 MAG: transcription termination/antitermination protein NusA [Candidatus Roizmanbacteria bacterium CG22_combo_CG10-13_8_21_14_all_38_20]PJC31909.1 MAG: transcription termination/antitermination protein NusA [Candidatus Roizmanbacteria bacterium CG_4_9_14_0_2_um_filter_38_17]